MNDDNHPLAHAARPHPGLSPVPCTLPDLRFRLQAIATGMRPVADAGLVVVKGRN